MTNHHTGAGNAGLAVTDIRINGYVASCQFMVNYLLNDAIVALRGQSSHSSRGLIGGDSGVRQPATAEAFLDSTTSSSDASDPSKPRL